MLKTATSLLFCATACCAAARAAVPFLPPVTLYVANEGQIDGSGSSVSVIDARNLRTKATINFAKSGPIYPIVSPDGKFLWVVHYVYNPNTGVCDDSGVSVVSLVTMKIETTLSLPQCPTTLAFSPNGRFAYVPSPAGPLTVIDTATRTAVASITVSTGQYGIALSLDGRWLYVADAGDTDLTVVDTTTNRPVRQITLNSGPFSLVLTPDGKRAFVWIASATDSFEEVRLTDGASVAMIPPAVSTELEGLAITPNGQLLLDVDYAHRLYGFTARMRRARSAASRGSAIRRDLHSARMAPWATSPTITAPHFPAPVLASSRPSAPERTLCSAPSLSA